MNWKIIEITCHARRSESGSGGAKGVFNFLLYSQVAVNFRAVKYKSNCFSVIVAQSSKQPGADYSPSNKIDELITLNLPGCENEKVRN